MNIDRKREDLVWEEVKTKHVVQDEWIDFRESAYRFPDGTVFEPYYSYSRRDYVVIVPFDTEGNLICVRQYRQGIGAVTTEFPAGAIERGEGKEFAKNTSKNHKTFGNSPDDMDAALDAAKRELTEETGFISDEWEHLITVPSNATIADNYAYVYMAGNCRRVSGQSLDDTEFLNVEINSAKKIEELIKRGEFQQALHVMAWFMAKDKKGK